MDYTGYSSQSFGSSTPKTTTSSTGGGTSPFAVSAGIQAVGAILGAVANKKAIKANLKAVQYAINESKNDYIRQLASTYEKENIITEETRDMLSARGLEAMKAESRLRAGISSTGLTGASMNEARQQSKYDQLFDNTVIIARSRKSKEDLSRERMSNYIGFKNQTKAMADSVTKNSSPFASALIAGLTSGMNTITTGAAMGGKLSDLGISNNNNSTSTNTGGTQSLSKLGE